MRYSLRLTLVCLAICVILQAAQRLAWAQASPSGNLPAEILPPPSEKPVSPKKKTQKRASAPDPQAAMIETLNANTVSVISGTSGATYFRIASDLAFTLDDGDKLRILPILGKGAEQNGYDLLFLKGIDLGLVRTDTLEQLKADKRISNPASQLVYIARLFNDEMHVIAPSDITDLRQLANRKVNFDVRGSGSNFTGRAIFQILNIPVEAVNVDQASALEMLRRGEIAAVVSVAAKPVGVVSGFKTGGKFHLVPVPYAQGIADRYFPATLSDADYPDLLAKGETINTIAVGTILGAYNWPESSPRYQRIARFVEAFFTKFDEFSKTPRHPKWQEVNLAATVQGWTRFKRAQEWLDRSASDRKPVENGPAEDISGQFALFQQFLTLRNKNSAASAAPPSQESLFKEFLEWNRKRTR